MQQVGAKGFANAQLVDPRQLPVPIADLSRRARINFSYAWILHRKLMLRLAAAGIVAVAIVGAYEAREAVVAGAMNLYGIAQGEFARAGFGIDKINISGQSLTSESTILTALGLQAATSTVSFDADAALVQLPNVAEFYIVFFALLRIGVAPVNATELQVAAKVKDGTITSSPALTPLESRPRCCPEVPELTATQARPRPKCSLNSSSKALTSGP